MKDKCKNCKNRTKTKIYYWDNLIYGCRYNRVNRCKELRCNKENEYYAYKEK
jgi:hypothetical protein